MIASVCMCMSKTIKISNCSSLDTERFEEVSHYQIH